VTLWASRDGQKVVIHGNIGLDVRVQNGQVAEYAVHEDAAHVRGFWTNLGALLDQAEADQKAEV
jgi:hypothetical protein